MIGHSGFISCKWFLISWGRHTHTHTNFLISRNQVLWPAYVWFKSYNVATYIIIAIYLSFGFINLMNSHQGLHHSNTASPNICFRATALFSMHASKIQLHNDIHTYCIQKLAKHITQTSGAFMPVVPAGSSRFALAHST